jgi:hypothetical protein
MTHKSAYTINHQTATFEREAKMVRTISDNELNLMCKTMDEPAEVKPFFPSNKSNFSYEPKFYKPTRSKISSQTIE